MRKGIRKPSEAIPEACAFVGSLVGLFEETRYKTAARAAGIEMYLPHNEPANGGAPAVPIETIPTNTAERRRPAATSGEISTPPRGQTRRTSLQTRLLAIEQPVCCRRGSSRVPQLEDHRSNGSIDCEVERLQAYSL